MREEIGLLDLRLFLRTDTPLFTETYRYHRNARRAGGEDVADFWPFNNMVVNALYTLDTNDLKFTVNVYACPVKSLFQLPWSPFNYAGKCRHLLVDEAALLYEQNGSRAVV